MRKTTLDLRRRRLRFRAARRGFKEGDAILGTFATLHLAELDGQELDSFEALLEAPDQDVYEWLSGRLPPPSEHDTPVFARLKAMCQRRNPGWNV